MPGAPPEFSECSGARTSTRIISFEPKKKSTNQKWPLHRMCVCVDKYWHIIIMVYVFNARDNPSISSVGFIAVLSLFSILCHML